MKNNKFNFFIPILLSVFLSIGLLLGHYFSSKLSFGGSSYGSKGKESYQKIQDIIEILDNRYVDTINGDELFEATIADMLHTLDPHSNYIPARDLQSVNESIQGKFGGIGVRFFVIRDTICVTHVIAHSPSEKVGIKAGDKIIKIENKVVASKKISTDKIMSLLKGLENTAVNVTIARGKDLIQKKIVRGSIPISSISCSILLNATTGFIKIDQFSVNTYDEFYEAAAELKAKGMTKLILDLRNNGGGVLMSATKIVDEFLPGGLPIVSTKGEHSKDYTYTSTRGGLLEQTALTILINANSASASEIVAGAIQDNDRGTIVGRRSFGKGLVQEDVQLRDGSNLRLTIARYYTPTGRCIQKSYSGDYEEYYQDQYDRFENGELYAPDSSVFVDSLKFKTPKGKIVYGGGGIMPDVFVPFDSSGMGYYFTSLRYTAIFQMFAFDFVQNKRSKWYAPSEFNKSFQVSDELLKSFTIYAEKELGLKQDFTEIKHSKSILKRTLKAEIARQLWEEQGYFTVMNSFDSEVLKCLEIMKGNKN